MVFMPGELHGKDRQYHLSVRRSLPNSHSHSYEVKLIEDPIADPIFIARERIRLCYPEQGKATRTGCRCEWPRRRRERLEMEPNSSPQDVLRAAPVTQSMSKNS